MSNIEGKQKISFNGVKVFHLNHFYKNEYRIMNVE